MIPEIDFSQYLEPLIARWPWFLGIVAPLVVTRKLGSARFTGWHCGRAVTKGLPRLDPSKGMELRSVTYIGLGQKDCEVTSVPDERHPQLVDYGPKIQLTSHFIFDKHRQIHKLAFG